MSTPQILAKQHFMTLSHTLQYTFWLVKQKQHGLVYTLLYVIVNSSEKKRPTRLWKMVATSNERGGTGEMVESKRECGAVGSLKSIGNGRHERRKER